MAKEEKPTITSTTPIDFSQDALTPEAYVAIPANVGLNEVASLAQKIVELEHEQEELKLKQNELVRELWRLTTDTLPAKMLELGLSSFTLEDGTKITLGTAVSATWPKEGEKHVEAVTWMRDKGYGDLVKDTVAIMFGKGELNRADELISLLDQGGFSNWNRKEEVHHQTLKAWIKEMVELGKELPLDLFSAEIFTQAKLKIPK